MDINNKKGNLVIKLDPAFKVKLKEIADTECRPLTHQVLYFLQGAVKNHDKKQGDVNA